MMKFQKRIKKFIFTNWMAKLVILLAVAGLWTYVASTESTVGNFPGTIEIKTINRTNGFAAIYDQKEVSLKIMADPPVWRALSERSFSAYVDLSGLEEGTYELPINVTCSVKDVQIVDRNPASIMVRIERNITKTVPVVVKIEGSAAPGLIAGETTLDSKEAEISGPESTVSQITEVAAVVRLNGESNDFTKTISLAVLDDTGNDILNIIIRPETVAVQVSIIKAPNNKSVAVKVRTTGSPKDGLFISKIVSDPQNVDIVGPENNLSNISFVETAEIDVTGLDQNLAKTVSLKVPSGVALQSGAPTVAKITITLSESSLTRQVSAKIVPINLDSRVSVTSYSPQEVKVLVAGPTNIISGLSSNDVVLSLDLSGKSAGAQTIGLLDSMFTLKDGLSILSIAPSSLVVTLENR